MFGLGLTCSVRSEGKPSFDSFLQNCSIQKVNLCKTALINCLNENIERSRTLRHDIQFIHFYLQHIVPRWMTSLRFLLLSLKIAYFCSSFVCNELLSSIICWTQFLWVAWLSHCWQYSISTSNSSLSTSIVNTVCIHDLCLGDVTQFGVGVGKSWIDFRPPGWLGCKKEAR